MILKQRVEEPPSSTEAGPLAGWAPGREGRSLTFGPRGQMVSTLLPRTAPGPSRALPPPPAISTDFYKAHGHGNDYLVFPEGRDLVLDPALVRLICDRWRGPGADGIVVVGAGSHPDVAGLRMFNPDGSEFERSGNGLRIAATYLGKTGRVGRESFTVTVGGDRVEMMLLDDPSSHSVMVRVDMGPVSFPDGPPFVRSGTEKVAGEVELEGIRAFPVSVGNPHAVVFGSDWDEGRAAALGPRIATHATFPQGTNVQFAGPVEGRVVPIHIWERGVGRTTSSGTSACAVAAATVRSGRLSHGPITVRMVGGDFEVTVTRAWTAVLEGPVEPVYSGRLDPVVRKRWEGRVGRRVGPWPVQVRTRAIRTTAAPRNRKLGSHAAQNGGSPPEAPIAPQTRRSTI